MNGTGALTPPTGKIAAASTQGGPDVAMRPIPGATADIDASPAHH